MRIIRPRNPFTNARLRDSIKESLKTKFKSVSLPSEFQVVGIDDDGQPWSAWGNERRATFWSGTSIPVTAACVLKGKKFGEVVTADGLLKSLADWFIIDVDCQPEAGLLLTCRHRWPEWA